LVASERTPVGGTRDGNVRSVARGVARRRKGAGTRASRGRVVLKASSRYDRAATVTAPFTTRVTACKARRSHERTLRIPSRSPLSHASSSSVTRFLASPRVSPTLPSSLHSSPVPRCPQPVAASPPVSTSRIAPSLSRAFLRVSSRAPAHSRTRFSATLGGSRSTETRRLGRVCQRRRRDCWSPSVIVIVIVDSHRSGRGRVADSGSSPCRSDSPLQSLAEISRRG